jgi:hypothetical protein
MATIKQQWMILANYFLGKMKRMAPPQSRFSPP